MHDPSPPRSLPRKNPRRSRRGAVRLAGADRRSARALQSAACARAAHVRRARGDGRHRRALCARMARAAGGLRLPRIRPGDAKNSTLPEEQAMVFADPGQPRLHARRLRRRRRDGREPAGRRGGVQDRQGCRLGRPGTVPVLRDGAILPPRLPHTTCLVLLAALAGGHRRTGSTQGGVRRRRRLRSRLLDDHDGEGVPQRRSFVGYDFHPGSVARGAPPRRGSTGFPPTRRSRSRWPHDFPGRRTSTSSPSSTACTTWAIRPARRGTCARALKPDGTWMVVEPQAGDTRGGEPQSRRSALLRRLDDDLHPDLSRPTGRPGARRAGGLQAGCPR